MDREAKWAAWRPGRKLLQKLGERTLVVATIVGRSRLYMESEKNMVNKSVWVGECGWVRVCETVSPNHLEYWQQ